MYARRKSTRIEASLLLFFGLTYSHSSILDYPLIFLIKVSYNTVTSSVTSNFCCSETEQRKLQSPLTKLSAWHVF